MKTSDDRTDIEQIRALLMEIEHPASQLSWAKENPARAWKVANHTCVERGVVTIDLHELGQNLTRRILNICEKVGSNLSAGAIRFVTGRGSHSVTGPVLRKVVGDALIAQCKRNGWSMHPEGGARFMLIIDPQKAPASATGALTWPLISGAAAFVGLAIWISLPLGIGLCFVGLLGWLASR